MTDLILPPLLTPAKVANPFETAIEQVRAGRSGAGDLLWAASQTEIDFAIILEPENNRSHAFEMVTLALVALSDCLAVLLPPQVAVQFRNETQVVVNGGVVGGVTGAMAKTSSPTGVPDWLVLSVKIGLQHRKDAGDPGLQPDVTTLDEEGWEKPDLKKFIETFARHFLSWMAIWDDDGFSSIARAYKFKAEGEGDPDMTVISKKMTMFESKIST